MTATLRSTSNSNKNRKLEFWTNSLPKNNVYDIEPNYSHWHLYSLYSTSGPIFLRIIFLTTVWWNRGYLEISGISVHTINTEFGLSFWFKTNNKWAWMKCCSMNWFWRQKCFKIRITINNNLFFFNYRNHNLLCQDIDVDNKGSSKLMCL